MVQIEQTVKALLQPSSSGSLVPVQEKEGETSLKPLSIRVTNAGFYSQVTVVPTWLHLLSHVPMVTHERARLAS